VTTPTVLPVVVDAPQHVGLSATLDYEAHANLAPGTLVQVPLGRRSVPGIVWRRRLGEPADGVQLRHVQAAITGLPPLGLAWMQLFMDSGHHFETGSPKKQITRRKSQKWH